MQAYAPDFARVYNERWIGFAQHVAPLIQAFYKSTPIGQEHRSLLDLCCGTGQLSLHFLENGYRVTGVDLAEQIRNFLRDKYSADAWGIEQVLLVGHYDDIPMRVVWQDLGYGYPQTDTYYAELSLPLRIRALDADPTRSERCRTLHQPWCCMGQQRRL